MRSTILTDTHSIQAGTMDDGGMQHCSFKYLIGFHCNTCGLDGDNLGSDEAETVHIGWVVVEADTGKVS